MRTLEQEFAGRVYRVVLAQENNAQEHQKRYGAMAQKLPVLIRSAGLAQALAFVDAKATGSNAQPYHQLLDDLANVLEFDNRDDLLRRSREADLPEYTALTRRAILALAWFKRFSQSILKVDPTQGE